MHLTKDISVSNDNLVTGLNKPESRSSTAVRSIDLQIIPYSRGNHPLTGETLPLHWAIFAHTGPGRKGTIYQLKGMPGGFRYEGPETNNEAGDSLQEVDIGRIPSYEVRNMEAMIAGIQISRSEVDYNCQTWTEDVLKALQPHGWLDLSPSAIVQWLKGMEA